MEGIEKIFNPKKTIFLGMDDQGRIQGRGRFFGELKALICQVLRRKI
jgi:hypothetical protein